MTQEQDNNDRDRWMMENQMRQERNVVSRDVVQKYRNLLVERTTVDAAAASTPDAITGRGEKVYNWTDAKGKKIKVKITKDGQIVEVEDEAPKPEPTAKVEAPKEVTKAKTEALADKELEALNDLEEKFLASVMEKYLKDAREKVGGLRHSNLVPYNERDAEFAMQEVKSFRDSLVTLVESSGTSLDRNVRAKEVIGRLDGLVDWVQGNIDLYLVSGASLNSFFDGWDTLRFSIRNARKDMMSRDLDKKYAGRLKDSKEGTKGQEVLRKQDQMYEIYRGIAGVHHSASRNRGEKINTEDNYEYGVRYKKEGGGVVMERDEMVERRREKFINEVMSHGRTDTFKVTEDFIKEWAGNTVTENSVFHKGVKWMLNGREVTFDRGFLNSLRGMVGKDVYLTRETQFVESIGEVWQGKDAKDKLENLFKEKDLQDTTQTVVVGERHVVNSDLIKQLRKGKWKTVWVQGVEWKVDENTIEELVWSIGSGDTVFTGSEQRLTKDNFKRIKGGKEVALVKRTAASIDNIYTMDNPPKLEDPTRQKLSLMLDENVWDKLAEPNADVDAIIRNFNRKLKEHRISSVNDHLMDTERIALLFFAEGADLGWGFDYKHEDVQSKRAKERKGPKTKVVKRDVVEGSTDSCTDIATALNWVRTDAKNTRKFWPSSILPLDEKTQKQIVEHEPGWAPWFQDEKYKKGGWWKTTVEGLPFPTDVPTRFRMTLLDTITMVEPTEEMIKLTGKESKITPTDLMRKGQRMSDVDWRSLNKECQYRWFITFGQLALMQGLFGGQPDKKFVEQFWGDVREVLPGQYLEEMNKRFGLGVRDLKGDPIKKIMPYAVAAYDAWKHKMLDQSLPGEYVPRTERSDTKELTRGLLGMAPKGDHDFGKFVAGRFNYYMDNLRPIALTRLSRKAKEKPLIEFN